MNLDLKHIGIFIFCFLAASTLKSQNNPFTNVDTNYLRPAWMESNLKVKNFRNGDAIYQATSISDFENKWVLENKPAFIIIDTDKGFEYLYNWESIRDPRGLAPIGFIIPSPQTFKLYSDYKNFSSLGYVDNEFIPNDGNSVLFWTNLPSKDSTYHADAFLYNADQGSVDSYNFPMHRSIGLSVRCIEDLNETIKTSDYSYNLLMPKDYKKLLLSLVSNIRKQHKFNDEEIVLIRGKVGFSREGVNLSTLSEIETMGFSFKNLKNVESTSQELLTLFNSIPYYKGQILQSETSLNMVLQYEDTLKKNQEFYSSNIKNLYNYNTVQIERASSFDFKCNIQETKFTAADNLEIFVNESTKSIKSFKSKGPIYALGSFIPGLGMSMLTSGNYNSNSRTKFKKSLWISSLSLGTVAIASKIYSNHYYKQYRTGLTNSNAEMNYNKANISQKIFLSSVMAYGVLGLIDFSFTFTIGTKNKVIQTKLNNTIKKDNNILLN